MFISKLRCIQRIDNAIKCTTTTCTQTPSKASTRPLIRREQIQALQQATKYKVFYRASGDKNEALVLKTLIFNSLITGG